MIKPVETAVMMITNSADLWWHVSRVMLAVDSALHCYGEAGGCLYSIWR